MDYPVARDVAEQEFERFADAMDLDFDPEGMDSEDIAGFEKSKRIFIRAVRKGNLTINDDGEAVLKPVRPASKSDEPLHFRERTGATLAATDSVKEGKNVSKSYVAIAQLCRCHPKVIHGLAGSDYKTAEAIFLLLVA